MNPLFTVIIPSFNAAATIEVAINSVLSQSFTNFELLVIDGMSTDDTVGIITQFANRDERVHYTSEQDNGIYDAMNKGIGKARGEWIYFLGSDDSFFSDDVLFQVSKVKEGHKESRMIYGNVQLNQPIGFEKESLTYGGEFHTRRILYANICHQSIFYHRSLFQQLGLFNTKYKLLADWDFNLRCFNLAKPFYMDMIVANFFVGATSMKSKDHLFIKDMVKNMVFTYPYPFRHSFFHGQKKALFQLLINEIKSLSVSNAYKISRTLFYSFSTPQ